MSKRLYRSNNNKMLGGVCGGIAEYFDLDPVLVRLFFVITLFAGGTGLLAYIVAVIIIPERPRNKVNDMDFQSQKDQKDETDVEETNNQKKQLVLGAILIFAGIAFLFRRYFYWFSFSYMWPVVLIIIGCFIIFREGK